MPRARSRSAAGSVLFSVALALTAATTVACERHAEPPAAPPRAPLPSQGPQDEGVPVGGLVTVGVDEGCAPCHEEVVAGYQTNGMQHSLTLPTGAGSPEAAAVGTVVTHPDTGMTVRFDVGPDGYEQVLEYADPSGIVRARHRVPVHVVIGSGHAARSYVAVRDGVLQGLPLSWYRELDGLGVSPGTVWADEAQHLLTRACIGCHTGSLSPRSRDYELGYEGALTLGIGCARCHGDGTQHNDTGDPRDIVSPARLDVDAQSSICFQCHMGGAMTLLKPGADLFGLRPGAPVGDVLGAFAPIGADEGTGVAGHAERMRESRCFQERPDMTCTTCHNPHEGHRDPGAAGRASSGCGICHHADACAEPMHGRGDRLCADCHMARRSANDIAHIRVTDHHVQRRLPPSAAANAGPAEHRVLRAALDDVPLRNLLDPDDALAGSKSLKAEAYLRGYEMSGRRGGGYVVRALAWSAKALGEAPDDPGVRLVRARTLHFAGRAGEARKILAETVSRHPSHLDAQAALAFTEVDLGLTGEAIRRLAAVMDSNPNAEHVPDVLAEHLARAGRFAESLAVLERAREHGGPKLRRALAAADAALAAGDRARSLAYLWDALIFRPRDPDLLVRAGMLLSETGGPAAEALALVSRAAELAPGDAAIRDLLQRMRSSSR